MKNKRILIAVGVIAFVLSLIGGYYIPGWIRDHEERRLREAFMPPAVPKKQLEDFAKGFSNVEAANEPKYLPDTPFIDTKGKAVRVADFYGKPLLVNLWATWCLPCVVELPSLNEFAKAYDGKITVVGIAMETGKKPDDIAGFLEKRKIGDFAGYLDQSGDFGKNLSLRGIPTSFLIGRNGQILYRFEGDADWMSPQSREFFDVFLLQNR